MKFQNPQRGKVHFTVSKLNYSTEVVFNYPVYKNRLGRERAVKMLEALSKQ